MYLKGIGSACGAAGGTLLLALLLVQTGFAAPAGRDSSDGNGIENARPTPSQARSPEIATALGDNLIGRIPLRFEQASSRQWVGRGFGFGVGVSDEGAIIGLGDRGLRLRFPGADPAAAFVPDGKAQAPNNYFSESGTRSADVYHRLRRTAIYPGVDLVYYGHGQSIEYDFELEPGADAGQIRMLFDGTDRIELGPRGELILTLDGRQVVQNPPVVYQRTNAPEAAGAQLVAVASSYYPEPDGSYSIRLGGYDRSKNLVIDPEILFTAYLAGTGSERIVDVGLDANGTFYLAGGTRSDDFPLVGDPFSSILQQNPNEHVFTTKLNPLSTGDDVITYSGFFGSGFGDQLNAMAVDDEGVMYLTGVTDDFFYPVTESGYRVLNGNVRRMFFSVLDTKLPGESGLLYSTFFGGGRTGFDDPATETDESLAATIADEPTAIAIRGGKVYIAGFMATDDFPLKNPIRSNRNAGTDGFLAVFDPAQTGDDSLLSSTLLGGFSLDIPKSIDVDAAGRIYVAGYTHSSDFTTTVGSYKPFYSGGGDAFVMRFDADAQNIEYSTYLGTSTIDQAWNVAVEPDGKIALAGFSLSADFPVTQNAMQPVAGGGGDAFLTILDPDAELFPDQLFYSTFYGGTDGEVPYDMKRGTGGVYYLSGYTLSRNLPVRDPIQPVSAFASTDGFVAAIDPSRAAFDALLYSSYVTGGGFQIADTIAADPAGVIYVAGTAFGEVGPNSPPPDSNTNVFVLVFRPAAASSPEPAGASGEVVPESTAGRGARRRK